jgi:DNA-binding NarL/FixJ family response regulator
MATDKVRMAVNMRSNILTETEARVLNLVARGAANQEIATALSMSEAVVSLYRRDIYNKLGARNGAHAIYLAMGLGLIEFSEAA